MMELKIAVLIYMASTVLSTNIPKVYEDFMEHVPGSAENIRTVREPTAQHKVKIFHPPVYNYGTTSQQDPQKFRYAQQQQIDLSNLLKRTQNYQIQRVQNEDFRRSLPEDKISHRNKQKILIVLQRGKSLNDQQVNEEMEMFKTANNTKQIWSKIVPIANPNPRSNKKLQPSSYFEREDNDLAAEGSQTVTEKLDINRQDHFRPIVYVQPSILKQNFGLDSKSIEAILSKSVPTKQDHQLAALNDLIGKNPNIQLEGLKKLLDSAPNNFILPSLQGPEPFKLKDHTPIIERTEDIPNPQTKPNIKVEHPQHNVPEATVQLSNPSLEAIQAQLDATSKVQAEQAIARASQEALAHVAAQHKAIAIAQAQAQKTALEQVAAQNSRYDLVPQALPLTSNVITVAKATPTVQTYTAVPAYAPNHNHQAVALLQAERAVLAQVNAQNNAILQARAQKEAAARQHALAELQRKQQVREQEQESAAETYQQVVLETNHQTENVKKIYARAHHQQVDDGHDDLQYAAKYAFGYRIKDVKMGNDFGHEEQRDGKSAKGHYHVLLPDGRLQKVDYYVDDNGYHAKVTYENVAHH